MGKLNILKANWTGKVGQTVGSKWKNISTIRSYTKPAYTDTPEQVVIRTGFGHLTHFFAAFTEQIKSLSALNTKGMSVRNALIQLNKAELTSSTLQPQNLAISRGGLPPPMPFAATAPAGLTTLTATWTPAVGATVSVKARVVVVFVSNDASFSAVGSALNSAGTLSVSAAVPPNSTLNVYAYLLDYRGSSKVGSISIHTDLITPAA